MSASRASGVAMLLACVALVACLARAWSVRVLVPEHARFSNALAQAQALDARLDEEVARSRLGIVTHYDGLVRISDLTRTTAQAIETPPRYLADADRAALDEALRLYRDALERKRSLVEDFKTQQAVLRNSVRALPHNAARLATQLRARPDRESAARAVEQLELAVVLQTLSPSETHAASARARLAAIDAMPAPDEPELRAALGLVQGHARVVLERHAGVDEVVQAIMTLEVSRHAARAAALYTAGHDVSEGRARAWRIAALAGFAAVLLLGAVFVIVRLRSERDHEAQLAALKSRFVSMTSHEFRTPLSVIVSSAELLESYGERWDSDKRRRHVERIQLSADAMTQMLDQVLLIGRAEASPWSRRRMARPASPRRSRASRTWWSATS